MPKPLFYAYVLPDGKQGVVSSWKECEKDVQCVSFARFKGFKSREDALQWLKENAGSKSHHAPGKGIYCDSGTGRGLGVEVKVTDQTGASLLHKLFPKDKLTEHGTYRLSKDKTNNYGELLGMKFALKIAAMENIKAIYCDSSLIVDYWSVGGIQHKDAATIALAKEVTSLRKEFEKKGGNVHHVSGGINPADLGFHRA